MSKILFIDTETGGLDPEKHSLLTASFVVYEDGEIKAAAEWRIKHKDYIVNAAALKINNIDLVEHDSKASEKQFVVEEMIEFIIQFFGAEKPVIAGHNIQFDINFIAKLFKECKEFWPKYASHRTIDTCGILRFLYHAGKIQEDVAASDKAFKYFGIEVAERHTAYGDVCATVELYKILLEIA
jgi:DNA polymerase III epsilon subunit-like protein